MSHGRSPETREARAVRLATFALAVIGVLLCLALVPRLVTQLTQEPLADVRAYYDAATRLNQGLPLYPAHADTNAAEFYRYPPLLAIAFRPLAAVLSFQAAALAWEAVTLAAFALTLRRLWGRPGLVRTVAILAWPIAWSLSLGQAQVVVTLLTTVASPLAIALAGQLKLFPVLVALYFVGNRDWRWLRRFLGWSLALVALQVVLEPRGSLDFLAVTNLAQVGQVNNLSVYAVSPVLWAAACLVGAVVTLRLAPTRWGWLAASVFAVVATPRLLLYLLMATLAGLRRPPAEDLA